MKHLTLIILLALAIGCAYASQPITPLDPKAKVEGLSAVELSAEWWKWAMSSPDEINPVRDISGIHCDTPIRLYST